MSDTTPVGDVSTSRKEKQSRYGQLRETKASYDKTTRPGLLAMASSQKKREWPYGQDDGARAPPPFRSTWSETKTTTPRNEPYIWATNPFLPQGTFTLPTPAHTTVSQRWQVQGYGQPTCSTSFPPEGVVQASVASTWRGRGELACHGWGAIGAWHGCPAPEISMSDSEARLDACLDDCLDISQLSADALPGPDEAAVQTSAQDVGGGMQDLSNEDNDVTDTTVCYGMISFPGSCKGPSASLQPMAGFPVTIESDCTFKSRSSEMAYHGKLAVEYIEIVQALLEVPPLELQMSCAINPSQTLQSKGSHRAQFGEIVQKCTLSLIIYGPAEMSDDVGAFFQEADVYLQDPKGCDHNVKYCNPHRLSSLDCCPMVFDLSKEGANAEAILFAEPTMPELIPDAHENLTESHSPDDILKTSLKMHQKQALTFLLRRESGWDFRQDSADFWDLSQTGNTTCFVNRISQTWHTDEPPEFCGGIVADPMGLGKTLTMIALAATDHSEMFRDTSDTPKLEILPTLIIVPPPLLDTWQEQLEEHVKPGAMSWGLHYGDQKLTSAEEAAKHHIILSTYHTVALDWGSQNSTHRSFLFSASWSRIVLDEAHMIRNAKSRLSKAVCALKATSRWAVTGTPVQNSIRDMESLLKFIRAHPYDDSGRFDSDIGRLWKSGNVEDAAKKLRTLTNGLVLRRPKTVIKLPNRTDLKLPVEFSPEERKLYDELKAQTLARIEEAYDGGDGRPASMSYITVLQRINALRVVCDLGLNYSSRHNITEGASTGDWKSVAQLAFDHRREMYPVACAFCGASCNLATAAFDDGDGGPAATNGPYYARCFSFVCGDCARHAAARSQPVTCKHSPEHDIAPVSLGWSTLEDGFGPSRSLDGAMADFHLSSKVNALIEQLLRLPAEKKSVVFSSWTMTLDLLQAGLERAGIRYERFDGKVAQRHRDGVIKKFRKDTGVKVLLLTLSCGAAGLTLTEASMAFLMEPHWNPTVEEQALARIHRLGQKSEVTTVRFFVKDTFEERVLELQQSKKKLEGLLVAPQAEAGSYDGLSSLEDLRRLI
ncbi:hypothetical protein MAPG_11046 [Magnaporthiopsis poae ATCC 64411]|uniref:Uncharacterized protein n=1 Tax=Magnaporthiopsis poae (strain ATCC 64411 / 73-15) TaxID=644358 RepID=A0A0C4EE81_MAGP6|nr:hypothetical protein MAPG_11046 [Magnaporthiopsis poae ATCC 64411]